MNYKPDGYQLQVGDVVEVSMGKPIRYDKVTRVTKTMAICEKIGYSVPVRYPRTYGFGFTCIPYQRSNIRHKVIDK